VDQTRGDLDFPEEARRAQRGRQLGVEHFECDGPVMAEILSEEHRRHASPAEFALQPVSARNGGTELLQLWIHRSAPTQLEVV